MTSLDTHIATVRQRIDAACRRAGRPTDSVRLIAVSKTVTPLRMAAARAAGLCEFGESYAQEALAKQADAAGAGWPGVIWHFIGPLQGNKTRPVAEHFDWVHAVDRARIADRLSAQRPAGRPPLQVLVQVNVSGEATKSGCRPDEAAALCRHVATLPNLQLRGLMTLPAPVDDPELARPSFRALRTLADTIRAAGGFDTSRFDMLSMGMSDDFDVAIEEGATLIRVGSALFGARPAPPSDTDSAGA